MVLIYGGAYQGKLDFALERSKKELSVFQCVDADIDFSKDIINSFHLLVLAQMRNGTDTLKYIEENYEQLKYKIVICDDISCGVVPMEKENRLWREAAGRAVTALSKRADEVIRVFCGIGMRIK